MPANECVPFYEPGSTITAHVDTAVTGKRFVAISATKQAGSFGLASDSLGGNVRIAPAAAATRGFGVAKFDGAAGSKVPVYTQPGIVIPVTAGSAITAGQQLEIGDGGTVVPLAAGVPVGMALASADNGADVMVKLY